MRFSYNKTKQGLGEVQTTYKWLFTIHNSGKTASEFGENLQVRVTSSTVPKAEKQIINVEAQGHTIKKVGKVIKAGEITLVAYDGIDAKIAEFFLKLDQAAWSGSGDDTEGKQVKTSDLVFDAKLELLDGDDKVTQTYTMIDCITHYEAGGELGQTSDSMKPTIRVEYGDYHHSAGSVNW